MKKNSLLLLLFLLSIHLAYSQKPFANPMYEKESSTNDSAFKNNFFSRPYPNPANEYTSFEYKIENKNPVELRIFNVLGKEMVKKTIANKRGEITINTVDFDPGIYFYSFMADKNVLKSGKLNIKK